MKGITHLIFFNNRYSALWYFVMLLLTWTVQPAMAMENNPKKSNITYRAKKLESINKEDEAESYKQLVGNAVFQHEGFTLYADSVKYFDKRGVLIATGHLHLEDREGGIMTAEEAQYDTYTKVAHLLHGVSYQHDSLTFYTEELDYFVDSKIGEFKKGAIMRRHQDQLTSQTGSYDQKNSLALFGGSVVLLSKDYHIFTDSLAYRTDTHLASLYGATKIISQQEDHATLTTPVGGEYNTDNQYAIFKEAHVEAEKYSLRGDRLEANPEKKYYSITGKAAFTSKEHKTTLMGAYAYYQSDLGIAEVYGDPLLQRVVENDTLFLSADTLKVIQDKADKPAVEKNDVITAYNNVKIYNQTLQGIADSIAYHSIDSVVYFYNQPVFWSYDTQLTSDQAHVRLVNENLDQMKMFPNAFIVSEDSIGNFNQVKGRELVATFVDNKIAYIDILGNGETLYFALDGTKLIGMNYIKCGHIRLEKAQGSDELTRINFFAKPIGTFYPPQKIQPNERTLEGLAWRSADRPTLAMFLARHPEGPLNQAQSSIPDSNEIDEYP